MESKEGGEQRYRGLACVRAGSELKAKQQIGPRAAPRAQALSEHRGTASQVAEGQARSQELTPEALSAQVTGMGITGRPPGAQGEAARRRSPGLQGELRGLRDKQHTKISPPGDLLELGPQAP
mmetsp:Transcript_17792/g.27496  ORF Transcript_17792/g.27496 Transcript_17792/m.27496 type:complete len:123 (-) Transcript_17792:161-529(-)